MHEHHAEPTEPTDATGADGSAHDPVQAGIEQLQRAALEAIRAGRALLDAAECVLQDPSAAEAVVRSVGGVARTASEAVAGFASGRRPAAGDGGGPVGDDDGATDGDPPHGFERISVS